MKLIFATGNRHKLEEVSDILGGQVELHTPAEYGITEDIPENEPALEGNASAKAWYIYDRTSADCFADDTGLEVEALGGEPGVLSARYAGEVKSSEDNMDLLLEKLEGNPNRRARFRTVISLIIDGREHQFEGVVNGTIIEGRHGSEGFGYDPIFRPDGFEETFAQMNLEQKNQISHRALATKALAKYLGTFNSQK